MPAKKETTGPGSDKPFEWKCKNGVTISLPSLASLDPDLGATEDFVTASEHAANDLAAMGASLRFLSSSLPEDAAKQLRQLKTSEFPAFMEAWGEHSGVTMGESSAS